jgi:predicted ATPase
MRIAISGTHSMGKTTLLRDCLEAFPGYVSETEAYRSLTAFNPDLHIGLGAEADLRSMWILQGDLMGKLVHHRGGEDVFFDRSPVDMIPYGRWAMKVGHTDLDERFLEALRQIARIYAREFLDAILFISMSPDYVIPFENDGVRPTEVGYRETVDAFFKEEYKTLDLGIPVIELNGPRQERVRRIGELIGRPG